MKQLRILFAVLLTVVTLSHSRPSQAAVGALVSPAVLVAGIYITAVSGGATIAGLVSCHRSGDESGLCKGLMILFGVPVVLLGLVVLDGEQGVEFHELNEAQAARLGVSDAELAIYNSEIDQANMLLADVKSELTQLKKPTESDSIRAWQGLKDLVSPETYSTMQKIVSQK